MNIRRTELKLKPDHSRVIARNFMPSSKKQVKNILDRISSLPEEQVRTEISGVFSEFEYRHKRVKELFLKRYKELDGKAKTGDSISDERKMLFGAYFTHEYSIEAAALFNPSIVWHPDQSNIPPGSKRFVLSLRATGEGHISSIEFRSGIIDSHNNILLDDPGRFAGLPQLLEGPYINKKIFAQKLSELGILNDTSSPVLNKLPDIFSHDQIEKIISDLRNDLNSGDESSSSTMSGLITLARSNYEIMFSPDDPLSERVIFPSGPAEQNGMEDVRFVRFFDEDGSSRYYGTFTAYDGRSIMPELIETKDFIHFKVITMHGAEMRNKGMALFPRKVNGSYVMLSRQDAENNYIMFSDQIDIWQKKEFLAGPKFPWEFIQMGNCGSPIETESGWLVLTHGVGPMRKYSISALLLDLNNPAKVLGRLKEPLISPNENEREGYVPNVVYSCGSLINNEELIIPYAMSDSLSGFAIVNLNEVLNEMIL